MLLLELTVIGCLLSVICYLLSVFELMGMNFRFTPNLKGAENLKDK